MIGRLSGVVLHKTPPQILLDVQGVGYELDVPMSTFCELPPVGQAVALWAHTVVREDAHLLYGFLSLAERECFRQLLKISGVGPKVALSVLSGLSVVQLADAVLRQDSAALTRVPGVGKKTAERLVLELRGRLDALPGPQATPTLVPKESAGSPPAPTAMAVAQETLAALLALGYSDKEARAAIQGLDAGLSLEAAIREALRRLSRHDG